MRILQINSVYGYGSTGRIVENLHKAIQKSGNESFVIYGRGDKSNDKNVFRIGNKFEQAIELMGTRLFNKHGQYSYITTNLIIKKIKEIKPDIVHLHNIHGYYVNFIKLISFLKSMEVKVVWLLHDTWLLSGSSADKGGLEYDWEKEPDINHLKEISTEYPKQSKFSSKQAHNNYQIKKELLQHTNFIFVTPSKWLSGILRKSYLKRNQIVTIHNGVDTNQFRVLDIKKDNTKINIIGVASVWEERKGLEYFDKLANDLDKKYSITLVGVTDEQAEKINTRINYIHRTNDIHELAELYNKADLFVNPTLYDNFPTVNLESQACGTPVITFDTGGSGESIIEGKTGNIIEPGNYNQLLKEIKLWPSKSLRIIHECELNSLNYSIDKMAKNYLQLFENIMK